MVIVRQSVDKAEFHDFSVEKILKLLFNHCESDEEGVRNVVAECLGKNCTCRTFKTCSSTQGTNNQSNCIHQSYGCHCCKIFYIVERPEKIDEINTWQGWHLAFQNYCHFFMIRQFLRTVDLGPFKHIVDDGLELRKSAFECVDTLLDSWLDPMNPPSFIVPYLKPGLDDHYDVKMPCHLILSKLADKCQSAVLAELDSLVDPLQNTINFKPKQEVDRYEDLIRRALRAIASLNRI
uniref:TATA-binding protein interacting (TIP20) domain-containing protein n=1 Tax=Quercus lobata TaxID=97700 RepID=A0A7N2MGP4_QUELO